MMTPHPALVKGHVAVITGAASGFGLEASSAEGLRQPAVAALRARGINAQITNAGVSGDTTAGGLQRLDFALSGMKEPPALAIISLGGNDMLREPADHRCR
mgnify:CR=1 FL=1